MIVFEILGQEVLIDEEDAHFLDCPGRQWTLRKSGDTAYVQRQVYENGRYVGYESLHRIITQCPVDMVVDHINRNGLDNRRNNLRICSPAENHCNRKRHRNNQSGLKGVYYDPGCPNKPWRAQIRRAGRKVSLGRFADLQSAHDAYVSAAKLLHGEFARAS